MADEGTGEFELPRAIHPLSLRVLLTSPGGADSLPAALVRVDGLKPGVPLDARIRELRSAAARVEVYPVNAGITVGRLGHGCHLGIDSTSVSRQHAEVERNEGQWSVSDLESSNGTGVEGTRIEAEERVPMGPCTLVQFGDVPFLFVTGDALAALLKPTGPAPPPAEGAGLRFPATGVPLRDLAALLTAGNIPTARAVPVLLQVPLEAEGATPSVVEQTVPFTLDGKAPPRRSHDVRSTRCFPLIGGTTVGRQGCDVVLADASVSSTHARLSKGAHGWLVTDLGSRNGTFLDKERLATGVAAPLRTNAQVWFGRYRTVFLAAEDLAKLLAKV
jgi:pSer/pThr/pTyr-binding forkhead associated (FHA) protein